MDEQFFNDVSKSFNFSKNEHNIIDFWKNCDIYNKCIKTHKNDKPFIFFEGPPTANGMPHPGHCLTRTIKDIVLRYKTMNGFLCERKAGWDTHGLPVEIEVCKELGIIDGGKAAIEAYGVEKFNRACIESVFRYKKEWENLTDRIGFWVNLDEAYVTFHQQYVESVWWSLKQLFDRGLLYQGHKVVWWWAQGGTALSAGEVGEGYRDVDDPAITVRLNLTEESAANIDVPGNVSILVWTTTPWTISSNCAVCVGNDLEYAVVRRINDDQEEYFILAKNLVQNYFDENVEIIKVVSGSYLIGLKYKPVFKYDHPVHIETGKTSTRHWEIISGDFVDLESGTGIVHLAPAFGEDDYRICHEHDIGFLCFVKPDGLFDERVTDVDPYNQTPIAGQFCKAADKAITRILKDRGQLFKHEQHRHSYPFCPRSENDPLIQYARKSWFIKTSKFQDRFLADNNEIKWIPEHIRDGRFGNFLENNVDWSLSRERYWGTPLPIWVCEKTGYMECISFYDELLSKSDIQGTDVWLNAKNKNPNLSDHLKIHKPYIDAITYQSPVDPSSRMRRVSEVIDVWYDAGCMPFAQWGYPNTPGSKELFHNHFPADFISEGIDQTRGWFYAMLAVNNIIFNDDSVKQPPYKNCMCLGLVHGEDGLKLSKRLKNYKDPNALFEKFSADAVRWSFVSKNPPTTNIRLTEQNVSDSQREILIRWHNVYSFFIIYANLDEFSRNISITKIKSILNENGNENLSLCELDRWIISELNSTIMKVRSAMDDYDIYTATQILIKFIDGLSNWYVRRSRSKFWESEWTTEKTDAYLTLYECLVKFSQMMAPFTPFYSETTWKNLTDNIYEDKSINSVHLSDFPKVNFDLLNLNLIKKMNLTRDIVNLGLSARRNVNIKVRQPIEFCEIIMMDKNDQNSLESYKNLLIDELNVKKVGFSESPEKYVNYVIKPNFKTLGPKFGQNVKKIAKFLSEQPVMKINSQIQETGYVEFDLNDEVIKLNKDDFNITLTPKEGFASANNSEVMVVISTNITKYLLEEGLSREFIRIVQDLRKNMGFEYNDKIQISVYSQDGSLFKSLMKYEDYISKTILSDNIIFSKTPLINSHEYKIEGSLISIFLKKIDN